MSGGKMRYWLAGAAAAALMWSAGCAPQAAPTAAAQPPLASTVPVNTAAALPTLTPTIPPVLPTPTVPPAPAVPTARPTPGADGWKELPVIPTVSQTAREIYAQGQSLGRQPQAFSKVGDCESRTVWFLGDFDLGPKYYNLGPYAALQDTVDYYQGSFGRLSQVARPGFTVASMLSPLWADRKECEPNESPLACEYRQHNPALALISVGTNDVARPDGFEKNLRAVIEQTLEAGIVPVLATKADNLEGNHHLNATIARLALEYDLPLWNFWRAVQDLPGQGLQEDRAHLTWSPNDYADAANLKRAWPVRNLTALQVLDALRQELSAD